MEVLLTGFERGMNVRLGRMIVMDGMWDFALDLGLHDDPRVAFRGSWALEWAFFDDRAAFLPHTAHFACNFLAATNGSVHRHYTKMMCDMLRRADFVPDVAQAGAIAEKTFDLLIDPAAKTAVKAWCPEILLALSPRVGWMGVEQLRETLRSVMEGEPSRGLANRAGKMLRRIDGLKEERAAIFRSVGEGRAYSEIR